jgi:hypothetical protein
MPSRREGGMFLLYFSIQRSWGATQLLRREEVNFLHFSVKTEGHIHILNSDSRLS